MIASAVFASALLLVVAVSCVGPDVGLEDGRLRACPSSPNCVCSDVEPGSAAHVEPFPVPEGVEPAAAFAGLVRLVDERASIASREPDYVHAVFKTRLMRFRDDFEARLAPEDRLIHVRSASRLGYSDLGANRRRVEELRAAYEAAIR